MNYLKTLFILFLLISASNAVPLENCEWNNNKGTPCITITKTPNTSSINSQGISKKVFTRQQIEDSGATTALELINKISGIDYYQTGQKGNKQQFLCEDLSQIIPL